MDAKEKILQFIKEKGLTNAEFERNSKLSNGYVNNLKGSIGTDKISQIVSYYSDLNLEWLITGKGEMLKPATVTVSGDVNSVIASNVVGEINQHHGSSKITNYNGMSKEDIIATMAKTSEEYTKKLEERFDLLKKLEERNDSLLKENKTLMEKCRQSDERITYLTDRIAHITDRLLNVIIEGKTNQDEKGKL
jgi:hypothetical protein